MQRIIGPSLAVLVACLATTSASAGDLESGLQPGDRAGAFNVKDITGPRKGQSLCYR